jgi:hypothetical protein
VKLPRNFEATQRLEALHRENYATASSGSNIAPQHSWSHFNPVGIPANLRRGTVATNDDMDASGRAEVGSRPPGQHSMGEAHPKYDFEDHTFSSTRSKCDGESKSHHCKDGRSGTRGRTTHRYYVARRTREVPTAPAGTEAQTVSHTID